MVNDDGNLAAPVACLKEPGDASSSFLFLPALLLFFKKI